MRVGYFLGLLVSMIFGYKSSKWGCAGETLIGFANEAMLVVDC